MRVKFIEYVELNELLERELAAVPRKGDIVRIDSRPDVPLTSVSSYIVHSVMWTVGYENSPFASVANVYLSRNYDTSLLDAGR